MGIERGALGSLLGHTGPVGESERNIARIFGAHRSYSVLNGTSASNRAIMSACVGDDEIALCDRNCHKSIEQGLAICGGIPVFLRPTRNRYGIIGPIPPERLSTAKSIAQCDRRQSARASRGREARRLQRGHELHVRRHVLQRRRSAAAARAERRSHSLRRGVVRLRALQPDVHAIATRCAATRRSIRRTDRRCSRRTRRTSCSRRFRRLPTSTSATAAARSITRRFNEAYCSQASTSPLYALIASNDVAAAMMDGPAARRSRRRRSMKRSPAASRWRARSGSSRRRGSGSSRRGTPRKCAIRRAAGASRSTRRPRSCSPPIRAAGSCTRATAGTASKACPTAGACSTRSRSASCAPA